VRFFFYGTLVDPDVRRAVLGPYAPRSVEPASLSGWRRVPVRGKTYPVIVADPAATVDGVLARGLNAAARRRLEHYEGDDLYAVADVEVALTDRLRLVPARVFVAKAAGIHRGRGTWTIATWRRRHKRRFLLTLGRRPAA
jgi:Gamma-glutamyl cyclotransferase, AIG2-like